LAANNWLLHHDNATYHTAFSGIFFFAKSNMTVVSNYLAFLFPRLKIKLKGCYFDITEVTEEEQHSMLNTPTEHDFQDAFKKWQKR
jgi:hypothetical protein